MAICKLRKRFWTLKRFVFDEKQQQLNNNNNWKEKNTHFSMSQRSL